MLKRTLNWLSTHISMAVLRFIAPTRRSGDLSKNKPPDVCFWKLMRIHSLIAISGLNGHAFGSFKKPGASYMWLRDTLAQDIPESRTIIYGYDSKL